MMRFSEKIKIDRDSFKLLIAIFSRLKHQLTWLRGRSNNMLRITQLEFLESSENVISPKIEENKKKMAV